MSDRDIRELERRAATGDVGAQGKLIRELRRVSLLRIPRMWLTADRGHLVKPMLGFKQRGSAKLVVSHVDGAYGMCEELAPGPEHVRLVRVHGRRTARDPLRVSPRCDLRWLDLHGGAEVCERCMDVLLACRDWEELWQKQLALGHLAGVPYPKEGTG